MQLRPIQDRVLVELDAFEPTFGDGVIVRPDIARDKPQWGTVRGVGAGVWGKFGFKRTTLRPGDRVLVPWAKGHDLYIGGKPFVAAREFSEADVLAIAE